MSKQNRNPKRSVALAAVFAIIAVLAFAALFWIYDGMAVVEEYLGIGATSTAGGTDKPPITPGRSSDPTESVEPTSSTGESPDDSGSAGGATTLSLPEGMTEDFALRMWQEQLDSQRSIGRMADGDIERISIDDVNYTEDESKLKITAYLDGGGSAQGYITMRRMGEHWYFTNLSGVAGERPYTESDVPDVSDVDVDLVNVMLEQQAASGMVLEEYATGAVEEVIIDDITTGPGTKTLAIRMNETHEEGIADIVLVSKDIDGKTVWFITRFTKK